MKRKKHRASVLTYLIYELYLWLFVYLAYKCIQCAFMNQQRLASRVYKDLPYIVDVLCDPGKCQVWIRNPSVVIRPFHRSRIHRLWLWAKWRQVVKYCRGWWGLIKFYAQQCHLDTFHWLPFASNCAGTRSIAKLRIRRRGSGCEVIWCDLYPAHRWVVPCIKACLPDHASQGSSNDKKAFLYMCIQHACLILVLSFVGLLQAK